MVLIASGKAARRPEAAAPRKPAAALRRLGGAIAVLAVVAFPPGARSQDRPPPDPAAGLAPIEPGLRGFGVLPVEGASLREMLSRCRQAHASGSRGEDPVTEARCDQLRRTIRNQPGNAVR